MIEFSPALTNAIESIVFGAIENLVQAHFGTTDASLIAAVAPGVADVINTVTKTNMANASASAPLVNVNGNATASALASAGAGIAIEAASLATGGASPAPGQ